MLFRSAFRRSPSELRRSLRSRSIIRSDRRSPRIERCGGFAFGKTPEGGDRGPSREGSPEERDLHHYFVKPEPGVPLLIDYDSLRHESSKRSVFSLLGHPDMTLGNRTMTAFVTLCIFFGLRTRLTDHVEKARAKGDKGARQRPRLPGAFLFGRCPSEAPFGQRVRRVPQITR